MEEKEYYTCCICGKLIEKENAIGNYESATCDECWEKYVLKEEINRYE